MANETTMKPEPQVDFDSDKFTDLVYNDEGKAYPATISYEYFDYDGAKRVTKCDIETQLRGDLTEDVVNLLEFRERKRVVLECKIQYL